MAVDNTIFYNGFYCKLRASMGPNYGTPNDFQIHNAETIYKMLRVFGYTASAACGILGNMQTESSMSPAALQTGKLYLLPNDGEHFADLTNQAMLPFYDAQNGGCGTGLIQWDGNTPTPPAGNKIVSFASRYESIWYDGEMQIFRLEAEYILDPSGGGGINGHTENFWISTRYNPATSWSDFRNWTGTPEDAADVFRLCLERSSDSPSGIQHRRENARQWYTRFSTLNVPIVVTGRHNAMMAYLFRDSGYTYAQYDCISFVNLVRRKLGIPTIPNGTNTLWRTTGLQWKGTMQECLDRFGTIPQGAYLFKWYNQPAPPPWDQDGLGDWNHIGIYTLLGKGVMQSGGYDDARTGVADCYFHPTQTDPPLAYDWWNYVAIGDNILMEATGEFNLTWFIINILRKKRRKYFELRQC